MGHKRNPFHPFSTFDTVTLAGMAFGQTVLARACEMAKIEFNTRIMIFHVTRVLPGDFTPTSTRSAPGSTG